MGGSGSVAMGLASSGVLSQLHDLDAAKAHEFILSPIGSTVEHSIEHLLDKRDLISRICCSQLHDGITRGIDKGIDSFASQLMQSASNFHV